MPPPTQRTVLVPEPIARRWAPAPSPIEPEPVGETPPELPEPPEPPEPLEPTESGPSLRGTAEGAQATLAAPRGDRNKCPATRSTARYPAFS